MRPNVVRHEHEVSTNWSKFAAIVCFALAGLLLLATLLAPPHAAARSAEPTTVRVPPLQLPTDR